MNRFKQNIKELSKIIKAQKPFQDKYEKENYLGNEIEKMLLRNASEKGKLARTERDWFEIVGNEKIWLGSMWNFALNLPKQKKFMWGYL